MSDLQIGDKLFHIFFNYETQQYGIFPVTLLDSEYADCYDKVFTIKPHSGISRCFESELFKTEQLAAQEISTILQKKIIQNTKELRVLEEERGLWLSQLQKFGEIACRENENQ